MLIDISLGETEEWKSFMQWYCVAYMVVKSGETEVAIDPKMMTYYELLLKYKPEFANNYPVVFNQSPVGIEERWYNVYRKYLEVFAPDQRLCENIYREHYYFLGYDDFTIQVVLDKTYLIKVNNLFLVKGVVMKLANKLKKDLSNICITYGGTRLDLNRTLSSYDVTPMDTIRIVYKFIK